MAVNLFSPRSSRRLNSEALVSASLSMLNNGREFQVRHPIALKHTLQRNRKDGTVTSDWERRPEKRKRVAEILSNYTLKLRFRRNPRSDWYLLPTRILEGVRWSQHHASPGPMLVGMPKQSWDIVKEEKADDMIDVLDLPYNGEPPRDS